MSEYLSEFREKRLIHKGGQGEAWLVERKADGEKLVAKKSLSSDSKDSKSALVEELKVI